MINAPAAFDPIRAVQVAAADLESSHTQADDVHCRTLPRGSAVDVITAKRRKQPMWWGIYEAKFGDWLVGMRFA